MSEVKHDEHGIRFSPFRSRISLADFLFSVQPTRPMRPNLTNTYYIVFIFSYFPLVPRYLSFHYNILIVRLVGGHDLTNIMLNVTSIQVMLLQLTISFLLSLQSSTFLFSLRLFTLYFTLKYDKSRSISRSFRCETKHSKL